MKMNIKTTIFIYLFIIPSLLFAGILGYTNDKSLNLEESINLALLNNRNLLIANEEINIIKYKTDEALSFRFTQLNLAAGYNHYNLETPYHVLDNGVNTYLLDNTFKNHHSVSVNMSQIIYNGRRTHNTKRISEVSLKKAKSEYEIIKQNIIYQTKKNFYKYMFYNAKIKFLENMKDYVKILNNNKNKFVNDRDIIADFNHFYKNFMFSYDETLIAKKLVRLDFLNVVGIEQSSLIKIEGELGAVKISPMDIDSSIAKALYSRPELMSSEALEELGFLEINISMAEKNPVIALSGEYQYSADRLRFEDNDWKENWYFGVTMNIPLLDGGAWIARNNQTKINLRKLKLKRSNMEEKIKLAVKNSFMKYEYSKRKLDYETKYYENLLDTYYKKFLAKYPDKNLKILNKINWLKLFKFMQRYTEDTFIYLESIDKYNENSLYLYYVMGEID